MPLLTAVPLNILIALLVFSILGTLTGLWIALLFLRHSALRTLTSALGPVPQVGRLGDAEPFGLRGSEETVRGLLDFACAQSGCGFALLLLPKHDQECLAVVASAGEASPWQGVEIEVFHPLIRRLETEGRPWELRGEEDDLPLPAHTTLFPILSNRHLLGLVAAAPRGRQRPISPRSVAAIATAATQAATTLEAVQLHGSLRRAFSDLEDAQRELLALQRVSVAAQSTLELEQVLSQIALGVVDGLSFDLAIVYLVEADQSTLSLSVVAGAGPPGPASPEPLRFDATHATMQSLRSNRPLVTHDLSETVLPRLIAAGTLEPDTLPLHPTVVNLPLASKGQVIGGMALTTGRPTLPRREIESLESFAAQAAATVENARLYGQLGRAYADLRAAQDQLIQAERLRTLGQIASGVAHDFNNILAAIITRAHLGQQQTRSATIRETLRVIEQAAVDGANAVRRIRSLGRPREDQPPELIDLNAAVQQTLELTEPLWSNEAHRRGVSIVAATVYSEGALTLGQASEIREVLTNLILNAAAAMPAGGTLSIRTEHRDAEVWCTVEDTGTGIPDEIRARIFEPFFTTKGESGSGLGLSIVAAIIERHHGRIEVESRPGEGTAIRFGLPARTGRLVGLTPLPRRGRVSLRLLLAENDEATREVLTLMLSHNGHRVRAAAGAEEAVRFLVEQEFDIVISDLSLGEHTGWEIAEATRVIRPSAAVVLTSAWGEDWEPGEVRERGVDAILAKPFTADQLLASLEQALLSRGP